MIWSNSILDTNLKCRIENLIGKKIIDWYIPQGGFSQAFRFVVKFSQDFSVFVKVGTDEKTAIALRKEVEIYSYLNGHLSPRLLAWEEDVEAPLIITEDLSHAEWQPQWSSEKVQLVLNSLKNISAIDPPLNLPNLEDIRKKFVGWRIVAENPDYFLSLGLCSAKWLGKELLKLIEAEDNLNLGGSKLVHFDVRSDNMCLLDNKLILIDWDWACLGNPIIDIATWLPGLHYQGGPEPSDILPNQPELAAWLSGCWAARAALPAPWKHGKQLRTLQYRQLKSALIWATKELHLEPCS
jgi:hypothetical protein